MTPFKIEKFQPKAWEILSKSFANNRTASTYLFHGPEGCGRWGLAVSFAALLNCEDRKSNEDGVHFNVASAANVEGFLV